MSPIDPREFLKRSDAFVPDEMQKRLEEASDLSFEQTVAQARSAAIRKLGLALKSSGFVKTFLKQAGFSDDVIQAALDTLIEDRYLDDQRLALSKVNKRKGARTESSKLAAQRLKQSGLSSDAIELALSKQADDRQLASQALLAKYSALLDLASELSSPIAVSADQLIKMKRFLLGRGFSAEIARDTIRTYFYRSVLRDEPEDF